MSALVDIPARLVHETELALLLDVGDDEPMWFPKSQCEFDGDTLIIPEHSAIQKGLI